MFYSIIGIVAILVHIIMNYEVFTKRNKAEDKSSKAFKEFLVAVLVYFISDAAWGIIYDSHIVSIIYIDTLINYISMSLSVVLWCRYVVKYLNLKRYFGKFLNIFGIAFCSLELVALVINHFVHIVFWIDESGTYYAYTFRYIFLIIQGLIFLLTALHIGLLSIKEKGSLKRRSVAICLFGIEMSIAVAIQIAYPLLPIYTLGLMIGSTILHTFVSEDEKREYRKDTEQKKMALEILSTKQDAQIKEITKLNNELENSHDSLSNIIEEQKKNLTIVMSLSKAYLSVYYIDLETEEFQEIVEAEIEEVHSLIGAKGNAREKFAEMCRTIVVEDYKRDLQLFTDLTTIADRLKDRDTIDIQFIGSIHNTWCSGEFIAARRDEYGECTHVVWAVRSINEQKEKEETAKHMLMQQLDLINTLSRDYLNVYVIDVDLEKVKIIKLNGYVIEGLSSEEEKEYEYKPVCDKYINNRVYSGDVSKMRDVMDLENIKRKLKNEDQYIGTYRVVDNGEIHYYQYKYVMIEGTNSIVAGFQNVDMMIIEEKQQQERLSKALVDSEKANKAKTTFLNNMSHDIRTPMNAILGFASLIKKHPDNTEKVSNYISKIEEAGDYLLSLINNVLNMSRIESGKLELNLSIMDVGNENSGIPELFMADVISKNLSFTHDMKIKHRYVLADEAKMMQVLINILSNAVKYTPPGGSINLHSEEYPCDIEGYGKYVTVVSDTGIGMSKEFQETIFESFSRERTSTESKIGGTGLGMSIVKKLVDLMGGKIEIDSKVGEGTAVRVEFLLKIVNVEKESKKEQENNEQIDLSEKSILLVEDNDLNAEIAETLLQEAGAKIERAKDGLECIEMLSNNQSGYYDIILMDIQMPRLNGYLATQKIRKMDDENKSSIPILAMTANAFDEDKKKARESGMDGHVSKPIDFKELLKEINRVL